MMHVQAGAAAPTLPAADLAFVRELVRSRSAIVIEEQRGYLVESRLRQLARLEGFDSIAELLGAVRAADDGLDDRLVEAMVTGETRFFRDPAVFEALAAVVVPERLAAIGDARPLRMWCGACSTGQEAYSLAMLLDECHGALLGGGGATILASDLARSFIRRAAAARYSALEVARGLEPRRLERNFERHDDGWRILDPLRGAIETRQLNLASDWPDDLVDLDIVLLRNVLLYLDRDARVRVLRRVAERMAPGGWLVLGAAETTLEAEGAFEQTRAGEVVLYRPRES